VRPVLITGATGTLGQAFARAAARRGLAHVLTGRGQLDIADRGSVERALLRHRPWAVVNAAGYVRVDDAESDGARCRRENTDGAACVAEACASGGIGLVAFSSDLVFDGGKRDAYREDDRPAPLNVYGASKLAAEEAVARLHPGALVVRTAGFFGPTDRHNFAVQVLDALAAGRTVGVSEAVVSPTYVPDLVDAALDLLIDGECGLWHLTSGFHLSWVALGRRVAELAGRDPGLVRAASPEALGQRARRPANSALASRRGDLLPSLESALLRFLAARPVEPC
jgi:dTDP-4-dehydrorhamnose reductase